MPLRGFLYASWTLALLIAAMIVLTCCAFAYWVMPFILAMVDKHPLVMDAINYTAPAFVIWGCDK